jgi:hypothetical protein
LQKLVVYAYTSTQHQNKVLANEIVAAIDQVRAKNIGQIVGVRTSLKEARQLANKLGASVVVVGANNTTATATA